MLNPHQMQEVQQRLNEVVALAGEIERVPNVGPDVWSMKKMDQQCAAILERCRRISALVGTGDVLQSTNIAPGLKIIDPERAQAIQLLLQHLAELTVEIAKVDNFGADYWSMKGIDAKCQQISQLCKQVFQLVTARYGTGDA